MLRDFVKYIVESAFKPEVKTAHGKSFILRQDGTKEDLPSPESKPDALKMYSLESLVDYVASGADGYLSAGQLFAHVVGPQHVSLYGPLYGEFKVRDEIAAARPMLVDHHFGASLSQEDFVVWMNTGFLPTDNLRTLLQVVSSLRDEAMSESTDDGISQTVIAKAGTARLAPVTIPNPIMLTPRRTFHEVEPVETPFLLRIKGRNDLCLREADGGAWKLTAMERVKAYLRAKMPEKVNVL